MNYTDLQTAVQDGVENTFSSSDFATMTKLAEQKIYNAVQLPNLRKDATLALTGGVATRNLPADFLAVYSLAVVLGTGAYEYLLNKDVSFIRSAYPTPATTGTPRYYALYGTSTPLVQQIIVGPTPGSALNLDMNYFYYPESIVTAGNTWLGDNFDSVLFNGVMVEAARWMKQEADIVGMYDKQFQESLLLLKNLGDGKNKTDQYRSGQPRTKVG